MLLVLIVDNLFDSCVFNWGVYLYGCVILYDKMWFNKLFFVWLVCCC